MSSYVGLRKIYSSYLGSRRSPKRQVATKLMQNICPFSKMAPSMLWVERRTSGTGEYSASFSKQH
jgi:hypothetical protein